MTITLKLKPEVEKGLIARARERGLTLDAYLDDLVQREAGLAGSASQTGKEKAQAFVAWARGHRPTTPLSDEAISRAKMYPERA
ncbi:MAG TPA: hypothetical protein VGK29_25860 [Paludibaculum sp.]|jgi:hypothetical protein